MVHVEVISDRVAVRHELERMGRGILGKHGDNQWANLVFVFVV